MSPRRVILGLSLIALSIGLAGAPSTAAGTRTLKSTASSIASHWTVERRAAAISRDVTVGGASTFIAAAGGALSPVRHTTSTALTPVTPLAQWTRGGDVQTAVGRLYFEMVWDGVRYGYVCSGTVVKDELRNYSVILTAAHCVFDDVSGSFAENVMFIPNQSASGTPTDLNCSNDISGCWIPTRAAVDPHWDAIEWPDNLAYDYGFYLVPTSGRHVQGVKSAPDSLESAVHPLDVEWSAPKPSTKPALTFALGYPYDQDPNFMYCSEPVGTIDGIANYTNLWLGSCAMGGGSSGGPWLQAEGSRFPQGDAEVFSLNSWGFDTEPGMAGPVLQDPARGVGPAHRLFNGLGAAAPNAGLIIGDLTTRF